MDHADLNSSISLVEPLTDRELDVLRLMADDLSNQQMADQLVLSPSTVKWYTQQIYGKLGIHAPGQKRRPAVARARALGLLEVGRTPAGRPRYSLPVQATPFVGRTQEINTIAGLLANPDVRLVTLLGPGGMGKTRLALEIGWRLVEPEAFGTPWVAFPNGVYFVPLQPVTTPDNMLWAVAEAVAFPFQSDAREPLQQLLDFFREKRLLLVMDNFEHLLEGGELVSAILQAAPGVQVLVTSRETLNLHAETVRNLDGLPFSENAEDAPDYDAARLFILGAQRACGDFALQPDDVSAVARICALVEGMPLAILLAAAWVEVLSVHEIAEEIAHSFDFLTAEMRDAPRRQWSIRAVFEPTWQRLSEAERDVFKRLSVFRGGCTRQAAQAVTGASLPVLQALVCKAVLSRTLRGRYEIHELLRQYAEDRLVVAGEDEDARDTHCAYYAEFMQDRKENLKGGDRQMAALDEIDADFENVQAAWRWAVDRRRTGDLLIMEWAVWYFLETKSRFAEGCDLFRAALVIDDDRVLLGRLMARYSSLLKPQPEQGEWCRQSLTLARETGDLATQAFALRQQAYFIVDHQRAFDQAFDLADQSPVLYQELGDRWGMARALVSKGGTAVVGGDGSAGLSFTEQALAIARQIGDRQLMAGVLNNIGVSYSQLGDYQKAQAAYEESLAMARTVGNSRNVARAVGNLGVVAARMGNYPLAIQCMQEGIDMHTESGHPGSIWRGNLAYSLAMVGRFDEVDECLAELALVMRSDHRKLAQWEYRNTQSEIAVVRGDFAAALPLAHAALEYAQRHAFPALESQSWVQIGLCEVKLGQYAAARQHVLRGLPGLNEVWFILYALYGVAAVAAAQQQPERAVELAALVYHHRIIGHYVKVFAGELLAELEATLPPDVYAAAVARGTALDLDTVVAELLEECAE